MLPIVLPKDQVEALMNVANQGGEIEIDLEKEEVYYGNGKSIKSCLGRFGHQTDFFQQVLIIQSE